MYSIFLLIILMPMVQCGSEPHCSRFHYEEKLLEKMIRMEMFVENMKTQVDDIQKKVEVSLAKLKEETSTWKTEIKTMQEENTAKLTKLNEEVNSELEKNLQRVEELKGQVVSPNVAFNAKNIRDVRPKAGNIIVFTETVLNLGESYNSDTGIFTAPLSGTYLFTVQLCIDGSKYIDYGLVVDEVFMNVARYQDNDSVVQCYGSATTVSVKSGNKVCIKVIDIHSSGKILYNNNSNYWNTFSGILINAD